MAAEQCGCGVRHRSEAAAARCPDAVGTVGSRVDAEDVLGVLTLMDGRLVRTASGVLPVSPSQWQCPPLPGQVWTQAEVFAVMAGLSGDPRALAQRLTNSLRVGLPVAAVVPTELAERTAAALTTRLKSAA
jgi:hypothetical protein